MVLIAYVIVYVALNVSVYIVVRVKLYNISAVYLYLHGRRPCPNNPLYRYQPMVWPVLRILSLRRDVLVMVVCITR